MLKFCYILFCLLHDIVTRATFVAEKDELTKF